MARAIPSRSPAARFSAAGLFVTAALLGVTVIAPGAFTGCNAGRLNAPRTFAVKLPAPRPFANSATPVAFEQQFQLDTGQTRLTRRAEFKQPLRIKAQSEDRILLHFDLSDWPEQLRPLARLWVCIGASNAFTTEVNVSLNFSQNGTGVSVPLNNSTSIDGIALMGCDFAAADGDVAVEIENQGLPRDVDCALHAIVYVPRKLDPD